MKWFIEANNFTVYHFQGRGYITDPNWTPMTESDRESVLAAYQTQNENFTRQNS